MKPLNKLEKEMFRAMRGYPIELANKLSDKDDHGLEEWTDNARAAAKVAVDLAKRAHRSGLDSGSVTDHQDLLFNDFLKSEGIETEK